MSQLQTIITEVNQIPLNLGNPSTKMNRIFSQAEEWMNTYYSLVKRCGIECGYTPPDNAMDAKSEAPVKVEELEEAIAVAESDISVELEEVIKMKEILEIAQLWLDKASVIAPKRNVRKKKRGNSSKEEKYPMTEISNLIDEASTIPLDIIDDLERLKIEQSVTLSWRLQAHRTIRDIILAFQDFRNERASIYSSSLNVNKSFLGAVADSVNSPKDLKSDSTNAHILSPPILEHKPSRSDSIATEFTGTSGSATPVTLEVSDKNVFSLISALVRSSKSLYALTPEEKVGEELNEVIAWFTKSFKMMDSPSELFDRKNFPKLDKLIDSGRKLLRFKSFLVEDIPEDTTLVNDVRQSWAAVMKDDIERLLDLQTKRSKFLEWCEKADEIISSSDKKISIETLRELGEQSAAYPSCK